ncbi:hypothetical protein GRI97_09525 [Altererythrobacter xixiisoli]|uniref:DUF3592 domain-containing protein n=1 Tax=Croceibacterium xixiisoli TaxID=1476466 RepID=A0A6I4TWR1_9SPHN|nr:hypothetical protein [Croceibacterium xixiisoli]MXO99227.1 hypothetical protein [Croceibacterium xixiisoli]
MSSAVMGMILPALLIIIAIIAALVWRGRQFGRLARHGVPVTGTVVRKMRQGGAQRIAFTYRGPDGHEYRRAATIALGKWVELAEGGPIPIICLPDHPQTSAPAWLIEDARRALKLQP